jgi:hypothetical protein
MIEEVHLFNLIDSRSVNFVHKATLTSSHLTDLDCKLVLYFNFVNEHSCGTHMFSNTIPVGHTMNSKLATYVHPLDMQ